MTSEPATGFPSASAPISTQTRVHGARGASVAVNQCRCAFGFVHVTELTAESAVSWLAQSEPSNE